MAVGQNTTRLAERADSSLAYSGCSAVVIIIDHSQLKLVHSLGKRGPAGIPLCPSWAAGRQSVSVPGSHPPGRHSTVLYMEKQQVWKQELYQPGAAPEEVKQGTKLLPLVPHGDCLLRGDVKHLLGESYFFQKLLHIAPYWSWGPQEVGSSR